MRPRKPYRTNISFMADFIPPSPSIRPSINLTAVHGVVGKPINLCNIYEKLGSFCEKRQGVLQSKIVPPFLSTPVLRHHSQPLPKLFGSREWPLISPENTNAV